MLTLRTYLVGLIIALVLLGQGVSAAHASEHGDLPHSHDGVVCDVTLLGEEMDNILPAPPEAVSAFIIEPEELPAISVKTVPLPLPHSRAPPPRAPPHTHI